MFHQILIWSASGGLILTAILIVFWFGAISIDVVYVGHNKQTSFKAIRKVAQILKLYHKEQAVFYDLGACRGNFVLWLSFFLPKLKTRGLDISHFRVWYANLKSKAFLRNAKFFQKDFNKADLSGANVVYMFLDQEDVTAAEDKLYKELNTGSLVITNTAHLNNWPEDKTFITNGKKPNEEKMFVYLKKDNGL